MPSGDLKIHNLRWKEHMGLYRCRAENPLGSDEVSAFVYPLVVRLNNHLCLISLY